MNKQPKTKLLKIAAGELAVHPTAQREVNKSKLKKFIENLDLDAIGVLHVVEYPIKGKTKKWIIDGQHRWLTLMEHGFGDWLVEIKIHLDVVDDAKASDLFLKLNDRAPVQPYDKFMNAVKAGLSDAVGASQLMKKHGLKVHNQTGDGNITCVSAIQKCYGVDSGETLSKTLDTVLTAWGQTASAVEGKLIEGISMVYARYNGTIDQPAMIKKLAKYPGGPSGLIGDAKGLKEYRRATLSRCVAERVIDSYNQSRRIGKLDPL